MKLGGLALLSCTLACAAKPEPAPPVAAAPTLTAPEPAPATAPSELPALLVMPLRAEPAVATSARALDAMILEAVGDLRRYRVLGPSDLNALLGVEQLKDAMGCDDVSCAAEIGGALGAPFLVSGTLGQLGDQVVLSLSLMDTKTPAVLARAASRGAATADAFSKMMSGAVGKLFGVELEASAPVAPAADYGEYTRMVNELSKYMTAFEYSKLLVALDAWEKRDVQAPAGTEVGQLLAYYRFLGCMMLKRPCTEASGAAYLSRWPDGMYATSIQSQLDQIETAAARRAEKQPALVERLKEIDAQLASGAMDAAGALWARAYAYLGGDEHAKAAELFERLAASAQGEKYIEYVEMLVLCYEQSGQLEKAHAILEQAKSREPSLFKSRGLSQRQRAIAR